MIYLDHAATTPLDPLVEEAMLPFNREIFGNPSSPHEAGRRARNALDQARDQVAAVLGAKSSELFFTSGGTESNNLAIKGVARAMRKSDRGGHVLTTAIEHPSVLESCAALEKEGFEVSRILPDREGLLQKEAIVAALRKDTVLVSVMAANNEVGTLQPVALIGAACRERGIPFHVDAVQAAGEIDLNVARLNVDLLTLSAHKLYGPKGVGALFVRSGTLFHSINHGGGQEGEKRAGTENVAGIVGLARALIGVQREKPEDLRSLRDFLLEGLLEIPGCRLHGSREHRLANNVNVGFEGVGGENLFMALDLAGIAVSTGSACSSGAAQASHVLLAMGYPSSRAREAIRLTLGRSTKKEELEEVLARLKELLPRLRR
ncbi:MAG TPA: cysteine desulfurase family protein [Chroococcales cyanobacterium]